MDKTFTCPRCKQTHTLPFLAMANPTPIGGELLTHFAVCPVLGHPILATSPKPKAKPEPRED